MSLRAIKDPALVLQEILQSPRMKQLRDLLAFVALVKFGGNLITALREFGVVGLILEAVKIVKANTFEFVKSLPGISGTVRSEIQKGLDDLENSVLEQQSKKETAHTKHYLHLPKNGMPADDVIAILEEYKSYATSHIWEDGKVSGAVYNGGEELSKLRSRALDISAWTNPLHPDVFPGVRKCEAEVISMVLKMYNGKKIGACGCMTSGGTESIMMAVRTHAEWAKKMNGNTTPHIVLPVTAHPAFDKACGYFNIRVTHIPLGSDARVDTRAVARAITPSTIMLVGSAPGYPHGIMDDIPMLARIAEDHGIGLHVDCCLGGFVMPFMREAGYPLPLFDFSLTGVTSISCDTHKYGFTPKGTSVVMYRTPELRRFQYFTQPNWPGGIYTTPTMAGSRPGSAIVACWATLMHIGHEGYVDSTRVIMKKQRKIVKAIHQIIGIDLVGEPMGPVVAFQSQSLDVYRINALMGKRGWALSPCQFPAAVHLTIVYKTAADLFISDLTECTAAVQATPNEKATGTAAIYGVAATIPDRSIVDRIARGFCDALYITHQPKALPNAEEVDADAESDSETKSGSA